MALWLNKDKFDISFKEHSIKEDIQSIANEVRNYCVVGISVSIWNVDQSKDLCSILKNKNPNLIIILGGPEVSYEPEFFIENWKIDYVVSGEGEFVLGELLDSLQNNKTAEIPSVSSKQKISKTIAKANIDELIKYPSPYQLEIDKKM